MFCYFINCEEHKHSRHRIWEACSLPVGKKSFSLGQFLQKKTILFSKNISSSKGIKNNSFGENISEQGIKPPYAHGEEQERIESSFPILKELA